MIKNMKNKNLTFQEISDKIISLTKEAENLLWKAKTTDSKFVSDCQFSLYKITKTKISKLEILLNN